jgi:CelD/BcsL family acetyltransferase involved in cellulose biosynthesis
MQDDALLTPFQHVDWCRQWSRELPGETPVIVIGIREGEPELIFPFVRRHTMGAKSLQWLAQHRNDYNAPLMRREALKLDRKQAAQILDLAVRATPDADFAFLVSQPKTIEGKQNPFSAWRAERFSTSAHSMTLEGGWPLAYERSRGEGTRKQEDKKLKRLRREGPLRLIRRRGETGVAAAVDRTMRWKRSQLAEMGAFDPFSDGLMQKVLTGLAIEGQVARVFELQSNGRPIAASVCLAGPDSQNHFITVYDPAFNIPCSPGTQMMNRLTELFARAGYGIFDFSAGDETYKLKICETTTEMTFAVRPLTAYGHLAAQLAAGKVHLRRWAKSQPAIFDGVHKARRLLRHIGKRPPALMHNAEQYYG